MVQGLINIVVFGQVPDDYSFMVHEREAALGPDEDGEALEVGVDGPRGQEVRVGVQHQDQALVFSGHGLRLRVLDIPARYLKL